MLVLLRWEEGEEPRVSGEVVPVLEEGEREREERRVGEKVVRRRMREVVEGRKRFWRALEGIVVDGRLEGLVGLIIWN